MTKVITEIPTLTLSRERVYNNAEMLADIPRILSGNALAQYVHTFGNPDIDADTRALDSMRSPSGAFGHDHSGGNHGRPFRRSVFSYSRNYRDNLGTSNSEEYNANLKQYSTTMTDVYFSETAPDFLTKSSSSSIAAFVPPCDVRGAYNELSFSAKFFKIFSANVNASDDITLTVENITTGSKSAFTGASLSSSSYLIRDSNDLLACAQGQINRFRFSMTYTPIASGSARSIRVAMTELNLFVNT